ncbi:MAG: hypothetical protein PHV11_04515 [Candidatus Bipolaricaulis sp.]|nr:hypothetical protein [Candidatus Bipolaricaulis sp.]
MRHVCPVSPASKPDGEPAVKVVGVVIEIVMIATIIVGVIVSIIRVSILLQIIGTDILG